MVCKLYKQYVHPLARVVCGLPISWGPNFATVKHSDDVLVVAWSPCSRFIAVGLSGSTEVRDAVTLERLHTFVYPESKNGWLSFSPDSRSLTRISHEDNGFTTWDLQTGGCIGPIPSTLNTSPSYYSLSTYSMDGKMLAVAGFRFLDDFEDIIISTYNLISGKNIHLHQVSEEIVAQIWTHGEFLRFATAKPGSITIWEVGFTSEHTLAKIESLPAPDNTSLAEYLFLPTLSRLAFTDILRWAVLIWDARDSKFLLHFVGDGHFEEFSFSSDGRFFACRVKGQGAYLWKESPTGYVLHQKFVPGSGLRTLTTDWIKPFLSPNGESIIISQHFETQLWRTTDPINSPSSVPPQPADRSDFVLAFSPDKSFIATGRWGRNIATIVDLRSGDPQLIVDAGMEIYGLGVTGSTVIVVGDGKIITWNLPVGNCVLDARANIHDSVRTIVFDHPPPFSRLPHSASISPDFNHLVITGSRGEGLDIYDMSTGRHLACCTTGRHLACCTTERVSQLWFTRDGREVWYLAFFPHGVKIIRDGGSDVIGLEPVGDGDDSSGGHPWESPHGNSIADDGWILDSRKKRVMWLPCHWRASPIGRIWDGQFLALFDPGVPEPVIIELYE